MNHSIKGGCVHGDSEILMANYTAKAIKSIVKGNIILDGNLKPVKVLAIGSVFLGTNELYKFEPNGPIFTKDHQFFLDLKEGMTGVVSLSTLIEENPQLSNSTNHVSLTHVKKCLQFSMVDKKVTLSPFVLKPFKHSFVKSTKLYYLWTSGMDKSYIVNGFLSKDEVPNFEKWPLTYQLLGLVIKTSNLAPYLAESYKDYEVLEMKTLELVNRWVVELENLEHGHKLNSLGHDNSFKPLILHREIIFEEILDTNLKVKFGMLLNKYASKKLHDVLESDSYPPKQKRMFFNAAISISKHLFQ